MADAPMKPVSLSDRDALEYLASMAKQAGAQPQEILNVLVREFQKTGRTIRINRVWSLKTLSDAWKKEHGEDFVTGPLTADKVKLISEALKTRLKETELALKENAASPASPSAKASDTDSDSSEEDTKPAKERKAKAKSAKDDDEDHGSIEDLQRIIEESYEGNA